MKIVSYAAAGAVGLAISCSGATAELPSSSPKVSAAVEDPVVGAVDSGSDPAVVAIDAGGETACAGALVAPDLVLTTRHCVSLSAEETACTSPASSLPALRQPQSLGVRVTDGGDFVAPRVPARAVLVPPAEGACGADVALLWLEEPVDTVQPLAVRKQGIARGGHVRSVGFADDPTGLARIVKRVRDHVAVVDTTPTELLLREAACTCGCGGPAIDESSGEIVGVVSRGGPDGDVATRVDAFASFIGQALAQSAPRPRATGVEKGKKGAIDMGANCTVASDCAAGVCVTDAATRTYCSRSCSAQDHCPTHFRCTSAAQGSLVCVQK